MRKYRVFLFLMPLYSGCSLNQGPLQHHLSEPAQPIHRTCAELFVATGQAVTSAGTVDSQAARIAGLPYLRVDRFLSSFRREASGPAFESWVDRLQELAMDGWRIELMNLPVAERRRLELLAGAVPPKGRSLTDALRECGNLLRRSDLDSPSKQAVLTENATVPEEYRTWQRIAGLYPLTSLGFRLGIAHWHRETLENYNIPLDRLPVTGRLVRYAPAPRNEILSTAEVAGLIKHSSENPLAIPSPGMAQQRRLFERFAPILEIDVASDDDRIGTPVLKDDKSVAIDTSRPTVYRHLSHARVGNRILLQLNYMIWFPARPLDSPWDLLGGRLDGLIWRVTLLPDGKPWMFDSIHLCGCYHLFFPTQHAVIKRKAEFWNEPDFVPQLSFLFNENARLVIRIASNSHYIDRVYSAPAFSADAQPYRWDAYDTLRSLPLPLGQRRSAFGEDGLVAGSERNERFLFWPMGIPGPGAMRQWGHHATAFVGRRHFDDPRLFERSFAVRQAENLMNQ
ncbi:MAG: hypothetical protein ACU841_13210 [Gammaproteobacteria bacterium]